MAMPVSYRCRLSMMCSVFVERVSWRSRCVISSDPKRCRRSESVEDSVSAIGSRAGQKAFRPCSINGHPVGWGGYDVRKLIPAPEALFGWRGK